MLQDLVYQAELQRLARVHELVPLQRLVDELQRLAGVLHVDGVQLPLQVGDLLRLDEDAAKTRDLTNWILRFQYSSTTNFIDTFL